MPPKASDSSGTDRVGVGFSLPAPDGTEKRTPDEGYNRYGKKGELVPRTDFHKL